MPTPDSRPTIALALSGGGFRATLFHLGAVRYLRAIDRLKDVRHIASVSGGSILAAHLAMHWSSYTGTAEQFNQASEELLGFTARDVRGRIVRRLPWLLVRRFLPLPAAIQLPRTTTDLFVMELRRFFKSTNLADISTIEPTAPRFSLIATNLTYPGITRFENDRVVNVPISGEPSIEYEGSSVPLHIAVACSAAYPAFFTPLAVSDDDLLLGDGYGVQYHADGGVIDNQGLQVLLENAGEIDQVLISDASGSSIDSQPSARFGLLASGLRSMELMMAQIRRSHYASFANGTDQKVVLINIDAEPESPQRRARGAVSNQLPNVRTDLDAFDAIERRELVHHGFHTACEAIGKTEYDPALAPPEPGAALPSKIAHHLRSGFDFRLRPFSWKDPVSAVNLLVVLAVLGLIGAQIPKLRAELSRMVALFEVRDIRDLKSLPIPAEPPTPIVPVASVGDRPVNQGFVVTAEDRVWDLTELELSTDGKTVVNKAYMTRYTEVYRAAGATNYEYWFETSGTLRVWLKGEDRRLGLRVLGPRPGSRPTTANGSATVHPYKGIVDCRRVPPGERFLIVIQAEYDDAFKTRADWWIGMSIADHMERASMRIIFPIHLPFRNPTFRRYPNNSRLESRTFDGAVLTVSGKEPELLWSVNRPEKGNTYRVNWDWYPSPG